jgi:4-hydroxy-tetrahydrodipicolinate reductase
MKIALIGYGKMGREIEKILLQRNHSIDIIIDKENISEFDSFEFRSAEVAIEFTGPQSAAANILKCFDANIPVVTGSTGWHHQLEYISVICLEKKQSLFYASNFSPGVNILFEVNRHFI